MIMSIAMYLLSGVILNSWQYRSEHFSQDEDRGICTGGCGTNEKLLPIMETTFNLRECAKQMILLEDHLNIPEKDCFDCQRKHCMNIEGLADEGEGLNGTKEDKLECSRVAKFIRECSKKLASGYDKPTLAQEIRQVRKPLMYKYFDKL